VTPCPSCHAGLDAHIAFFGGSAPPVLGDITVCSSCGAVLQFTSHEGEYLHPKLVLEVYPEKNLAQCPEDLRGEVAFAQQLVRSMRQRRAAA